MQETERKFLVNASMWSPKGEGISLKQGYLTDDQSRTVRVRISDDKCWLTIKGKPDGMTRTELEYEIPAQDAIELMKMALYPPVEKTRYKEQFAGLIWEVDVFEGKNSGLIMAEVELEHQSVEVHLPDWAEQEVTGDKRFYNLWLSKHPYGTW